MNYRQLSLETSAIQFDTDACPERLPIDDIFPIDFANQIAAAEAYNKHLYRPNTYLHKWWARRCGTTFRLILKQLVKDPLLRDFYAAGGLEGKVVLDPMMGGGTTLHEAIRMQANVIGADIDPIPVLQTRATLSKTPLKEVQAAFDCLMDRLVGELSALYQTTCPKCERPLPAQFFLYGVRKRCDCREVVIVDSYVLRYEDNRTWRICPDCLEIVTDECDCIDGPKDHPCLVEKDERICPDCGQPFRDLVDIPFYQRYKLLAIAGTCTEHGFFFRQPTAIDHKYIEQAEKLRSTVSFEPHERFTVTGGPKSDDLLRVGVSNYLDAFSSRQILFLSHAQAALREMSGPVRLLLAMMVSTSLEFNAMLCGYKGAGKRRPGAIRHVFAHHAYSFPYTAAENNPIYPDPASGNLRLLFRDRVLRAQRWAHAPEERFFEPDGKTKKIAIKGEYDGGVEVHDIAELLESERRFALIRGDSRQLPLPDEFVDFVVTDPPYYDSVQYSDLAEFFRVWLPHLIGNGVDWQYDTSNSAVATKPNGEEEKVQNILGGIFKEARRVLRTDCGRLIFTYHHWRADAWSALTLALKMGGFELVNYYVVFSENPASVHIQDLKAIKHDCILVLAPIGGSASSTWSPVETIDASDSYKFCDGCGAALGWLLSEDIAAEEVEKRWRALLS